MAGAWSRGWSMARESFAVLKEHPRLAILPVISGITALVVSILILGALVALSWRWMNNDRTGHILVWVMLFAVFYAVTATAIFFNAALIHCALRCHAGARPSLLAGLAAASRLLPQILGWAFVAATVGVALTMIQSVLREKLGFLGSLIGTAFSFSWGAMTYLVVPILVTERVGPVTALRRSSSILKSTWGESFSGEARFGLLGFLWVLLAALMVSCGIALATHYGSEALKGLGWTLIEVGVLSGIVAFVVLQTLSTIFQSGVYLYASTGKVPATLDPDLVMGTFRSRG
jgi:hypothetical protein